MRPRHSRFSPRDFASSASILLPGKDEGMEAEAEQIQAVIAFLELL
jgi:hypothetical protein